MNSFVVSALLLFSLAMFVSAWEEEKHDAWEEEKHDSASPYKYEYGVEDEHTHDHKSAWEHSDGHHVKGGYKFQEADGTHREVEYDSNGKGTNTIVKRVGHAVHPDHYGHDAEGHDHGHGEGKATSYANYNQYPHEEQGSQY